MTDVFSQSLEDLSSNRTATRRGAPLAVVSSVKPPRASIASLSRALLAALMAGANKCGQRQDDKRASRMHGPPPPAARRPAHSLGILILIYYLIFMQIHYCSAQRIYRRREINRHMPAAQPAVQSQAPSTSPPAPPPPPPQDNVVAEMQVLCHSDSIVLMVNTNTPFNGMLYAKDAAASAPNCLSEFHAATNMTFRVPLKACGTLMAEVDDGVEFFNTIVVQPHMRLMTNQGKGYHIRCKYQTRERTIANTHFNVSAAFLMQNGPQSQAGPLLATASMPMCTMKIYRIDQDNVAEMVRVGDKLVMVIEIDRQDMYGMRISNCVVRDGLNKAEQQLISDSGCPVDETIMPKFEYELNNTRAAVAFRAHKFPHTSSIYYQCNVRLCISAGAGGGGGGGGGCEQVVCPPTGNGGSGGSPGALSEAPSAPMARIAPGPPSREESRRKRFAGGHKQERFNSAAAAAPAQAAAATGDQPPVAAESLPQPSELKLPSNMSFDVYSGLYVSDATELSESSADDANAQQVLPATSRGENSQAAANSTGDGEADAAAAACLTTSRAGLLVAAASLACVSLVLLVACQAGVLSVNSSAAAAESRARTGRHAVDRRQAQHWLRSSQSAHLHHTQQAHQKHHQYAAAAAAAASIGRPPRRRTGAAAHPRDERFRSAPAIDSLCGAQSLEPGTCAKSYLPFYPSS